MASLISGIVAAVSCFCCCVPLVNYMAMPIAAIAVKASIITGALALRSDPSPKSAQAAKVGMGLGVAALLVGLVAFVMFFVLGIGASLLGQPPQ